MRLLFALLVIVAAVATAIYIPVGDRRVRSVNFESNIYIPVGDRRVRSVDFNSGIYIPVGDRRVRRSFAGNGK